MGTSVGKFFGEDFSEYEWVNTIKKKDIHLLIKALGGNQDDNILELIKKKCTGENCIDLEGLISDQDIPSKTWTWNS